ncbi:MAG: hypothetical protein WCU88_03285 [Elusimicrobiota bacterium]|jgi:hypothetical protein
MENQCADLLVLPSQYLGQGHVQHLFGSGLYPAINVPDSVSIRTALPDFNGTFQSLQDIEEARLPRIAGKRISSLLPAKSQDQTRARELIEYLNEIGRRNIMALGYALELYEPVAVSAGQVQNRINAITCLCGKRKHG